MWCVSQISAAYIHTYIHTHIHTCTYIDTHAHAHTHIHTQIRIHMHIKHSDVVGFTNISSMIDSAQVSDLLDR